jgi:hypothetical protein
MPFVNLGPPVITINSGQTITLDAGSGFVSYLWNTSATTQTINVNTTGVYYVGVTDSHGCRGSDTISVNVLNGINNIALNSILEIYPNPSSGIFNVIINKPVLQFNLQIVDITGRVIIRDSHKNNSNFNKSYNLSDLAKGVYYLQLFSTEGNATRTLLIQ